LTPAQKEIYDVFDRDGGYVSILEIAEKTSKSEDAIRFLLSQMREKVDFMEKTVGKEEQSYRKLFKLPSKFQDLDKI